VRVLLSFYSDFERRDIFDINEADSDELPDHESDSDDEEIADKELVEIPSTAHEPSKPQFGRIFLFLMF
jgi:hypothetical protein